MFLRDSVCLAIKTSNSSHCDLPEDLFAGDDEIIDSPSKMTVWCAQGFYKLVGYSGLDFSHEFEKFCKLNSGLEGKWEYVDNFLAAKIIKNSKNFDKFDVTQWEQENFYLHLLSMNTNDFQESDVKFSVSYWKYRCDFSSNVQDIISSNTKFKWDECKLNKLEKIEDIEEVCALQENKYITSLYRDYRSKEYLARVKSHNDKIIRAQEKSKVQRKASVVASNGLRTKGKKRARRTALESSDIETDNVNGPKSPKRRRLNTIKSKNKNKKNNNKNNKSKKGNKNKNEQTTNYSNSISSRLRSMSNRKNREKVAKEAESVINISESESSESSDSNNSKSNNSNSKSGTTSTSNWNYETLLYGDDDDSDVDIQTSKMETEQQDKKEEPSTTTDLKTETPSADEDNTGNQSNNSGNENDLENESEHDSRNESQNESEHDSEHPSQQESPNASPDESVHDSEHEPEHDEQNESENESQRESDGSDCNNNSHSGNESDQSEKKKRKRKSSSSGSSASTTETEKPNEDEVERSSGDEADAKADNLEELGETGDTPGGENENENENNNANYENENENESDEMTSESQDSNDSESPPIIGEDDIYDPDDDMNSNIIPELTSQKLVTTIKYEPPYDIRESDILAGAMDYYYGAKKGFAGIFGKEFYYGDVDWNTINCEISKDVQFRLDARPPNYTLRMKPMLSVPREWEMDFSGGNKKKTSQNTFTFASKQQEKYNQYANAIHPQQKMSVVSNERRSSKKSQGTKKHQSEPYKMAMTLLNGYKMYNNKYAMRRIIREVIRDKGPFDVPPAIIRQCIEMYPMKKSSALTSIAILDCMYTNFRLQILVNIHAGVIDYNTCKIKEKIAVCHPIILDPITQATGYVNSKKKLSDQICVQ